MKRVLVVGPSIPHCLESESASVIHQPLIELERLPLSQESLTPLAAVESLILTSKHAACFFHMSAPALSPTIPIFCVGPATAQATSLLFPNRVITASTHTQEGLIETVLQHKLASAFWPRSTHARTVLSTALKASGMVVYELPLYTPKDSQAPLDLEGIDEVFFTSPSAVTAFFSRVTIIPKVRARKKITSLSSTERDRRDVEDRDDVHSVLLTRNDPQQIDGRSQPNREVILLRALRFRTIGPVTAEHLKQMCMKKSLEIDY